MRNILTLISIFIFAYTIMVPVTLSYASPAPLQYVYFCAQQPTECRSDGSSLIRLTDDVVKVLLTVNSRVNRSIKPRADIVDEWSVNVKYGDCEDYALTKRHYLVKAGLPSAALRMVIAVLPNGERHAVLAVHTSKGTFFLDNLTNSILDKPSIRFKIISIEGTSWDKWS